MTAASMSRLIINIKKNPVQSMYFLLNPKKNNIISRLFSAVLFKKFSNFQVLKALTFPTLTEKQIKKVYFVPKRRELELYIVLAFSTFGNTIWPWSTFNVSLTKNNYAPSYGKFFGCSLCSMRLIVESVARVNFVEVENL